MHAWVRKAFYRAILNRPFTGIYDRLWPKSSLGARGELAAERFLLKQGLIVIERGYKDKIGEIDLIAADRDTVVFVEVKTRDSDSVLDATEAVDEAKQRQVTRTAKAYLKWHHLEGKSIRFDVIAVLWRRKDKHPQINHYPNAFESVGNFQIY
jgi:putative endonuclease